MAIFLQSLISMLTAMTFKNDTAWPDGLLAIFTHGRASKATLERRYYGPYDKLLNYCISESFKFYVAPQKPSEDKGRDIFDSISIVVYDRTDKPVLLVEVRDESWALKAELRYRADENMRGRYGFMLEECAIPRLWGLSLLATSMRLYCGDKETYILNPPSISRPDPWRVLPPSFLANEWGLDILSQDGSERLKEVMNDISSHA
ncbi:hypothetical protein V8D89_015248 [Ganoderma adspersum]